MNKKNLPPRVKTSPEKLGQEIAKGMGFRDGEYPALGVLIGYARVSTEDQNLSLQFDALTRNGVERDRIYAEHISGAAKHRPELEATLKAARKGDTIVVWKLDRLGRSLPELIRLINEMERRGIGFRSLTEYFDTTTAISKLMFHVLASLAEFERAIISERTKAGMAAAKQRGHRGGRKRKIDPTKFKGIKAMLADETVIMDEVCKTFGVSRSTIQRELKRDADEFKRRALASLGDKQDGRTTRSMNHLLDNIDESATARTVLQPIS